MLGTKLYKNNIDDMARYTEIAIACNQLGNLTIKDKGEYYEVVEIPKPSLEEIKQAKLVELKSMRDTLEVEPIEYNGNLFDYDEKARDRINAAIISLELAPVGTSLSWTTADNKEATVTANDLKAVIANVAIRSNELHVRYRTLKEQVNNATTVDEVNAIVW